MKNTYRFVLRDGGDFTIEGDEIRMSATGNFFLVYDEEDNFRGAANTDDVISVFSSIKE